MKLTKAWQEAKKTLEGRLRVAIDLQVINLKYSNCAHCQWPWWALESHCTMIDESSGYCPLCEDCWRELRESGKDDQIRGYYHRNRLMYHWDETEAEINDALDKDFAKDDKKGCRDEETI